MPQAEYVWCCAVQFMDMAKPSAPAAYFGLFASHWAFYGVFCLLATLLRWRPKRSSRASSTPARACK
jgi:hypothetical protein